MRLLFPTPALALLLLLSACGETPSGPVPADAAQAAVSAAMCELMTEHCPSPSMLEAVPPGRDCASLRHLDLLAGLYDGYLPVEEMVASGRLDYDADEMGRFLSALRDAPCDNAFLQLQSEEWVQRIFQGTVPAGEACHHPLECQEGTRCGGDQCPGTCEVAEPATGPCEWDGDCRDGYCGPDRVCKPRAQLGEPCTSFYGCAGGACGVDGVCQEAGTAGAWCQGAADCLSGYCDSSGEGRSYCAPRPADDIPCRSFNDCPLSEPICVREDAGDRCRSVEARSTAEEGEACHPMGEREPLCRTGLSCAENPVPDGAFWICREPAASGGACSEAVPSLCPAGEYCDTPGFEVEGTCRPLPVAGEACALWSHPWIADAAMAYCAEGFRCEQSWTGGQSETLTCVAVRPKGEACTLDAACETDQCGADGLCTFDFCG